VARWLAEVILSTLDASSSQEWFVTWTVGAVLGGALTGLALRRLSPAWQALSVGWSTGVWAFAWAIAWFISWFLTLALVALKFQTGAVLPDQLPTHLGLAVGGALGGYGLGWAWRRARPGLPAAFSGLLALGWAVAWVAADNVAWRIYYPQDWVWGWAVGGLVGGLLGGLATLWVERLAGASQAEGAIPPAPAADPPIATPAFWRAVTGIALAWGLAGLAGQGAYLLLNRGLQIESGLLDLLSFAGWVLAGLLMGPALRRLQPAFGLRQRLQVAGVWAVSWWLGVLAAVAVSTSIESSQSVTLAFVVAGAAAGLGLAWVWRRFSPALRPEQVLLLAAGWAGAHAVAYVWQQSILTAMNSTDPALVIAGSLSGLLAGLLGGLATVAAFTHRAPAAPASS
jgi:hypothetical protein